MSDAAQGPGWWLASDGRWYPPEAHPFVAPSPPGPASLVLNVLWLVLSGLWLAAGYAVAGVALCLLVLTIPFGLQCFKLAGFALWPFGRAVVARPDIGGLNVAGNVMWLLLVGLWMAIAHVVAGVALCLTVIGIPLGLGNFKLVPMILMPFGKHVVRRDQVEGGGAGLF